VSEAPRNLDAEASVLGACMLSSEAIATASALIAPEHFFQPSHGHIFAAVLSLYGSGRPVDPITLAAELTKTGTLETIGGMSALVTMQCSTSALSNVASHTRLIEAAAAQRRLIGVASEIEVMGYHGTDIDETLDSAERLVLDVADRRRHRDTTIPVGEAVKAAIERLERLFESGDSVTGVATGFLDLDDMTGGLQPDSLTIVGARPSMGKTAMALGMALHVACAEKRPVALFSLEMSQQEVTQRLICMEARVDSQRVRKGMLGESDWEKVAHAATALEDAPLLIDDDPVVTVMGVRSRARKIKHQYKDLGLVVVDYLQLMGGGSAENETLRLAEISRGLKILARELSVPVVALSQLSRGLEQRSDKRPMLSDLRQSGSLEQDADVVIFLYRDEVYDRESRDQGIAEVIVAKHRAGPTGLVRLAWMGQYTRFANMARS
jgi:replicative DNA helicase